MVTRRAALHLFLSLMALLGALFVATPAVAAPTPPALVETLPESLPERLPESLPEGVAGVPTDADYHPLSPVRIADTRGGSPVGADSVLDVVVTGVGGSLGIEGVPATGVNAVVLNVTAVNATEGGYLTVFPSGSSRPVASNLNFGVGGAVPNTVIAKVGAGGKVSIYNFAGSTDVIVDVQGWFATATTHDENPDDGELFEGNQYGWRFVPSHMLLQPGESRNGSLVQTDIDGVPTGGILPAGVTFKMTGIAGNVTVTSLGGTAIKVTAGSQIDTSMIAAQVPDTAQAPVMTVSVAHLKDGVIQIDDSAVAFPAPNLPNDAPIGSLLNSETGADGVGPFTWAQIQARIQAPDESINDLDLAAVLATVVRYPLVLRGSPPATGSFVVGSGGSHILGKVVEPVGLPTLISDGLSLISVELVGPQQVYDDLFYDLTYDDLVAIGAMPASEQVTATSAAPAAGPGRRPHSVAEQVAPQADPPAPAPDPTDAYISGPGKVTSGGGGPSALRECVDQMLANPQTGVSVAEFSPVITMDFAPTINAYVQITDGALQGLRLELGATLSATVAVKVKIQPTASFTLDCKLATYIRVEMAAPGPLGAILSVIGDIEQHFKLSGTITGGPKAEPGISCSFSASAKIGFAYDVATGNVEDLRGHDLKAPPCTADIKPSLNVSGDGIGASLELTVGSPFQAPLKVRFGGAIIGSIGRFLSWFGFNAADLGVAKGLVAEVTPQLRFTWETFTNAMTLEAAKSAVVMEAVGKISAEFAPLSWVLKIFGVASNEGNSLSITLFQSTFPLLNGYQPLNAIDGKMTATADGDTISAPAVYVQRDDEFVLQSVLGPTGGGISTSLSVPELQEPQIFEKAESGILTESNLFDVSVIASTGAEAAYGNTTVKVSKKITLNLCNEFRDAPRTFVLVANAPLNLFGFEIQLPAWGGKFTIQCVEGKVEWDPTEVNPLDFENGATVQVKSHGARDDRFTIVGSVGSGWLAVSPTTGDLTGGPDPVADAEEFDIAISTGTPGSVNCWTPRTATLTVSTEHRGAADLSVTEEDPCYLTWEDPTVTGPGTVTANLLTKGRSLDAAFVGDLDFPDWLHLDSPIGLVEMPKNGGNELSIPFSFTVDERTPKCTVQLPRHHEFVVYTSTRGDATLTITDPKIEPRANCGLRFTPKTLTDSGHSNMTLRDDDLADDETANWEIDDATVPAWLNVVPMTGTIESDLQLPVNFAQLGTPFDQCVGRPQRTATVMANAYVPTGLLSTKKVTGQIVITRPAIPPVDCPVTTGGAHGDPHMMSLDGVPFEGQILGEYIYTRSAAGTADPLEVVVRTQPTGGQKTSVAPTSVTAVALTYGGSTVEAYAGVGVIEVLVDGELVTLGDDVSVPVVEGLSVTRTGTSIRFDTPSVTVRLSAYFWSTPLMDMQVSAKIGSPLEGLLGSPDSTPANDFVGADGTPYTVNQIQLTEQPAFFDFVQSWRLTEQAQSPFTRSYAEFGAANPGFDPAILAEFGDDVDAALLGSDEICDGTITAPQRYGLALELSFGANAEIDRYICSYAVGGVATAEGAPVAGLKVTLDAVGVRSCTTTTGIDGRYLCSLTVDLDEVLGATGPVAPLDVSVIGRWPGLSSVAASGATTFTAKASFNHGPPYAIVALEVDPDSLPRIEVSGSMHRDGLPIVGNSYIYASSFDATGVLLLAWHESIETILDGSYSFTRLLPPTASRVELSTSVLNPVKEDFDVSAPGLQLGANPIEFNVDYTVPTATVSGTLTNGTVGLGGSFLFIVKPRNAAGVALPDQSFSAVPDAATGFYTATISLPRASATVSASVGVGSFGDTFGSAVTPVAGGTADVSLSGEYVPPTATVSGTLTNGTVGLGGSFYVTVKPRNAAGVALPYQSFSAVPDAATGFYTATIALPSASTTVSASVGVGTFAETFESALVPIVGGTANVTLSGVFAPPSVTFAGDFLDENGGAIGVNSLARIYFYNAAGGYVGGGGGYVPASLTDTTYTTSAVAPMTATKAQVTIFVGAQGESFQSPMITLLANQLTVADFDVVLAPVRLHVSGTLTDAFGVPLTGNYSMDVRFLGSDSIQQSYQAVTVTPDPLTGAYAFDVVGDRDAVKGIVTVYLGAANNYETRSTPIPSLSVGDNEFVYNVGFSPPVVTFTGRMTGVGGAPLAGPVLVYVQAHDDHFASVYGQSQYVTLDAEGDYSFTIVMPSSAVSVKAEARIGPAIDWFRTADVPIVVGNNTVTLDVDYQPTSVTVAGTLVSAAGVPLASPFVTGPISIGVAGHAANGDLISYTQPYVTPGVGGAYSFNVTMPRAVVSVDVRSYISGEDFVQTFGGFAPGVHQDVAFNVAYNPSRLNLSGVARKNGSFATGQVQAAIRRYSTPTTWTDSNVYMTIGANGVYGRSNVLLPVGTIKADVTVRLVGSPTSFSTVVETLVPGDVRNVVIDFDDQQTTVTVSGTLQLMGAPAVASYLYVEAFDANGASLPSSDTSKGVEPGPGGAFGDVTFIVPTETARAVVHAYLQAPGWNDGYSVEHEILNVAAFNDTSSTWDVDAKGVRITGSLTSNGERVVLDNDGQYVQFNVAYHTPNSEVSTGREAEYMSDNRFEFDMFVPLDATSVDLEITNAGAPQPTTTIDPLDDVATDFEWTAVRIIPGETTFIVYGNLTDGGVPITSQPDMTFEVIGYAYVDWDTAYTEVWRREFTDVPMDTGYYGFGWNDVPPEATLFRVTIKINGDDSGWSRGYDEILAGEVNQRQFDIELGASRLRYRGDTILDGCTAPLVFYREFWSFTAEPTEPYDWDTHTWPGGVLAGKVLVIPNLTAPYGQDTAVHLPPDGTWLSTVYYDHNSAGTGGGSFGPNGFGEASADETIRC